jgi:hypothetical protein
MRHIKLKNFINEQSKNNSQLGYLLEKDLAYIQERLIEEGLWDTIKQKVGGTLEKTGEASKELLIKPLVKVVLDKIAKDDPQGFIQLQQYAKKGPENIQKLLNHPSIKKQQDKVERELGSVQESLNEEQAEDFLQEYMDAVLEEARVLKDDPRNVARRARYAKRKADRLSGAAPTPLPKKDTNKNKKELSAGDNIKQGVKQIGKGVGQAADKAGQTVKGAIGGIIDKIHGLVKKYPKLNVSTGVAILSAIFNTVKLSSKSLADMINNLGSKISSPKNELPENVKKFINALTDDERQVLLKILEKQA